MFRRKPMEGTPVYKPKGYPDGATPRLPVQRLPLLLPMLDGRAGRGKDGAWWRDSKSQRLPCLFPESPYAPRGRGTACALLLPPLLPSSSAREAGAKGKPQPKDHNKPDTLGSLLGELLPHKFSHFLHKLRAKSTDPEADREAAGGGEVRSLGFPIEDCLHLIGLSSSPFSFPFSSSCPLPAPSAPQYARSTSDSRCSSGDLFLPDLW